jgi:hypothetical protein
MEPVLKIYLDAKGKVSVEGTIEDDCINLQVLLKCAEAVSARMAASRNGVIHSDLQGALGLTDPRRN